MGCPFRRSITVPTYDIVTLRKIPRQMMVDCGKCLNCLIKRQIHLQFLAQRELIDVYRSGRGASFVTLTYDDDHLPLTDSGHVTLRKADVQNFLKRIRRQMDYYHESVPFKVIYCGEYGDQFQRPHYHLVFLGLTDVQVAKYSRKLWRHGLCDIGVLAQGGLRYVLKYMSKSHVVSEVKRLRNNYGVENPFIHHSVGLGKDWILRHLHDIADHNYQFEVNGKRYFYPRYVCRFVACRTGKPYLPIFRQYFQMQDLSARSKGLRYDVIQQEDAEIRLLNNISAARSKGLVVSTDDAAVRKYIRPRSRLYMPVSRSLVDTALEYGRYGDVVPF